MTPRWEQLAHTGRPEPRLAQPHGGAEPTSPRANDERVVRVVHDGVVSRRRQGARARQSGGQSSEGGSQHGVAGDWGDEERHRP